MPHFEVSHFSPPGVGEGRATKSRSLAGGTHTGTAGRETGRASRPVPTGRVTAPAKTFSGKRPTVGVSGFARSSLISYNPSKKYEHRSWRTRAAQKWLRVGLAGLARGPRCAAPGLEREGSGALESGSPGPGVVTFKTVTQLCALLSHQSEPASAVQCGSRHRAEARE